MLWYTDSLPVIVKLDACEKLLLDGIERKVLTVVLRYLVLRL